MGEAAKEAGGKPDNPLTLYLSIGAAILVAIGLTYNLAYFVISDLNYLMLLDYTDFLYTPVLILAPSLGMAIVVLTIRSVWRGSARSAYIDHRGGTLGFDKRTMRDADLEIVGDRPSSFDLFQREYSRQLVAVYSKITLGKGLIAHIAGYSHFRGREKRVTPTYNHVNHCQSDMAARMQAKEIEFILCRG